MRHPAYTGTACFSTALARQIVVRRRLLPLRYENLVPLCIDLSTICVSTFIDFPQWPVITHGNPLLHDLIYSE